MDAAEQARRGIWTVPKAWPNATVACLASGPSLTAEVVSLCRGLRTIAVNDAYRLAPWADVLYACDASWWDAHAGVPTFRGLKVGASKMIRHRWPDVSVLRTTREAWSDDPCVVAHGSSSGYQAVNLAAHFGAVRILMVGYDGGPRHGVSHFFGSHAHLSHEPDFELMLSAWPQMVRPLAQRGITVVNCTFGSDIDVFPRGDLRDECCQERAGEVSSGMDPAEVSRQVSWSRSLDASSVALSD